MDARKISLKTVIAAMAAVMAVELLARVLVVAGTGSPLIILLSARLAETALLLAGIRVCQGTLGSVGLGEGDIGRGIKTGFAWAIVFGGLAAAGGALMLAAGIDPTRFFSLPGFGGSGLPLYLLTGAVVSPLAEELFFRGVLYGFFRRWGVTPGVVLSTVAFAGLHLSGPALPVTQIIGGIVFCLAYERGKSLLAPYVVHALGNGAIFSLGALS